jgi:hypothetical protein
VFCDVVVSHFSAHAKLCHRSRASEVDALIAIAVCEESIASVTCQTSPLGFQNLSQGRLNLSLYGEGESAMGAFHQHVMRFCRSVGAMESPRL